MAELEVTVVGAGLIGRTHIALLAEHAECVLSAVVDPTTEALELARSHDVPWYRTLDELLDLHRPDGVIIATPNRLHVPQALQCIAMRIPVLVEKPVATSVAEGEQLLSEVRRSGVPVLVGHHRVHSDILGKTVEILSSGCLGRLVSIMGSAQFCKPDTYFEEAAWRSEPGGGPVLINMIHEIQSLRLMMGEIVSVQAMGSNVIREFPVDDTIAMNLRFASGALGTFMLSDAAASGRSWEQTSGENPAYPSYADEDCYVISGTRGSLSIPTMRVKRFADNRLPSWWIAMSQETTTVQAGNPLHRQLTHFLHVLRGECEPLVSVLDGLNNLHIVEAIVESAQTGHVVQLDRSQ